MAALSPLSPIRIEYSPIQLNQSAAIPIPTQVKRAPPVRILRPREHELVNQLSLAHVHSDESVTGLPTKHCSFDEDELSLYRAEIEQSGDSVHSTSYSQAINNSNEFEDKSQNIDDFNCDAADETNEPDEATYQDVELSCARYKEGSVSPSQYLSEDSGHDTDCDSEVSRIVSISSKNIHSQLSAKLNVKPLVSISTETISSAKDVDNPCETSDNSITSEPCDNEIPTTSVKKNSKFSFTPVITAYSPHPPSSSSPAYSYFISPTSHRSSGSQLRNNSRRVVVFSPFVSSNHPTKIPFNLRLSYFCLNFFEYFWQFSLFLTLISLFDNPLLSTSLIALVVYGGSMCTSSRLLLCASRYPNQALLRFTSLLHPICIFICAVLLCLHVLEAIPFDISAASIILSTLFIITALVSSLAFILHQRLLLTLISTYAPAGINPVPSLTSLFLYSFFTVSTRISTIEMVAAFLPPIVVGIIVHSTNTSSLLLSVICLALCFCLVQNYIVDRLRITGSSRIQEKELARIAKKEEINTQLTASGIDFSTRTSPSYPFPNLTFTDPKDATQFGTESREKLNPTIDIPSISEPSKLTSTSIMNDSSTWSGANQLTDVNLDNFEKGLHSDADNNLQSHYPGSRRIKFGTILSHPSFLPALSYSLLSVSVLSIHIGFFTYLAIQYSSTMHISVIKAFAMVCAILPSKFTTHFVQRYGSDRVALVCLVAHSVTVACLVFLVSPMSSETQTTPVVFCFFIAILTLSAFRSIEGPFFQVDDEGEEEHDLDDTFEDGKPHQSRANSGFQAVFHIIIGLGTCISFALCMIFFENNLFFISACISAVAVILATIIYASYTWNAALQQYDSMDQEESTIPALSASC